MESSEEPRSKLLKSNSFEDQRPRSAGSVNYGTGPGSSRRTGGASPGPTSRYGAISPTGYFSDNSHNFHQVHGRPKASIADKVLRQNEEVQSILQSPQASIRLDTCPDTVAAAGLGMTPYTAIPAEASQRLDELEQGSEGGTDQPAHGRKRESTGDRRRRHRHHYSPTGSIASWNKSRSSTGESSFSTESQPAREPGSYKGRRLPPPLDLPPPLSSGPEPVHPSTRPPIPHRLEEHPNRDPSKPREEHKRAVTPSIIKETPRLISAEDFLPNAPPRPTHRDGAGASNGATASATPTGTTSGGSTANEDVHWRGGYQGGPHIQLQAGGPEDDLVDDEEIPGVQVHHRRAWRRCKCGCTLATLLLVVAFAVFVGVWAKVVSPLRSSSVHYMGFCETAKIDYNSLTSKILTVEPDIGRYYLSHISHEPCDVKMKVGTLNLTVNTTVNQTSINQPGLTRNAFLMEKENSSIYITVCIDKIPKRARMIFSVFKTADRMFEWEKDTTREIDCQIYINFDINRCVSQLYTDYSYCSSHQVFSGHHYISSQFVDDSGETELPIELSVKLDLTAPQYVPTKLKDCSRDVKTECHVDFSWFFGEVARKNWCVFLQTWRQFPCDSGLLRVEHTAHQRLDIIWLSAAIVVLVICGCFSVYWRLIFTIARASWRHRYFRNCRNYARLL